MTNRKLKIYAVFITVLLVLTTSALIFILIKGSDNDMSDDKSSLVIAEKTRNLAFNGWNNTMVKLDYDSDIVFFGDSHTSRSDFKEFFPEKKIVTLGCPGDNLIGMKKRVNGVAAVNPELVFVLGGENGLRADNVDASIKQYEMLIKAMQKQMPDAQIIIISALPVREDAGMGFCSNDVIVRFNEKLRPLAERLNCDYVDIHSLYKDKNGELEESLTVDGVHLYSEAYDRWAEAIKPYIIKNSGIPKQSDSI